MQDRHWTRDELVAGLFEVGPEGGHLARCPECARQWDEIRERRRRLAAAFETGVSEETLAAQRLAILSRLNGGKRKFSTFLAPAFAAAALIVGALFVSLRPAPPPEKPIPAVFGEDEALEEVFRTSSSLEPAALSPVRELFEEQQ